MEKFMYSKVVLEIVWEIMKQAKYEHNIPEEDVYEIKVYRRNGKFVCNIGDLVRSLDVNSDPLGFDFDRELFKMDDNYLEGSRFEIGYKLRMVFIE